LQAEASCLAESVEQIIRNAEEQIVRLSFIPYDANANYAEHKLSKLKP